MIHAYGLTKKELGINKGTYLANFDGIEIRGNAEDIKEYDYIHIYNDNDLIKHIPKRFVDDIENQMIDVHKFVYGDNMQIRIGGV